MEEFFLGLFFLLHFFVIYIVRLWIQSKLKQNFVQICFSFENEKNVKLVLTCSRVAEIFPLSKICLKYKSV